MSSIDDSKLTNIKLDDTNPDELPINAHLENDSSQMRPNQAINIDENYIRTFSSLFLDQINTQDVNAILESQQQMWVNFEKNFFFPKKNLLINFNSYFIFKNESSRFYKQKFDQCKQKLQWDIQLVWHQGLSVLHCSIEYDETRFGVYFQED